MPKKVTCAREDDGYHMYHTAYDKRGFFVRKNGMYNKVAKEWLIPLGGAVSTDSLVNEYKSAEYDYRSRSAILKERKETATAMREAVERFENKLQRWLDTLSPTPTLVTHEESAIGRGSWDFMGYYTGPSVEELRAVKIATDGICDITYKKFPCGGGVMVYHGGYD